MDASPSDFDFSLLSAGGGGGGGGGGGLGGYRYNSLPRSTNSFFPIDAAPSFPSINSSDFSIVVADSSTYANFDADAKTESDFRFDHTTDPEKDDKTEDSDKAEDSDKEVEENDDDEIDLIDDEKDLKNAAHYGPE